MENLVEVAIPPTLGDPLFYGRAVNGVLAPGRRAQLARTSSSSTASSEAGRLDAQSAHGSNGDGASVRQSPLAASGDHTHGPGVTMPHMDLAPDVMSAAVGSNINHTQETGATVAAAAAASSDAGTQQRLALEVYASSDEEGQALVSLAGPASTARPPTPRDAAGSGAAADDWAILMQEISGASAPTSETGDAAGAQGALASQGAPGDADGGRLRFESDATRRPHRGAVTAPPASVPLTVQSQRSRRRSRISGSARSQPPPSTLGVTSEELSDGLTRRARPRSAAPRACAGAAAATSPRRVTFADAAGDSSYLSGLWRCVMFNMPRMPCLPSPCMAAPSASAFRVALPQGPGQAGVATPTSRHRAETPTVVQRADSGRGLSCSSDNLSDVVS